MDRIMEIGRKQGLPIVEDSCQAFSAALNGKCVGTFGVTGAFSLHPLKNLNVWGDSGIIITDNEEIKNRLLLLRNHGLRNRDEVDFFGYNSRLDTIQAVVANHLLQGSEWITENRIKWANQLDMAFKQMPEVIKVPLRRKNKRYVHHLYMIMVKNRDNLLKYLIEKDIEAKIHYPIPLHLQKCSAHLGYKEGDFPVAENQARSLITLPVHQHLKFAHVEYMIDNIIAFYN
jgi:dTDP-4-amino-4,6-dideoxygalactose transaminase